MGDELGADVGSQVGAGVEPVGAKVGKVGAGVRILVGDLDLKIDSPPMTRIYGSPSGSVTTAKP